MTIRKVEIERLTVVSSRPFEAAISALEAAIGRPDMRDFSKSAKEAANYAELQALADRSVSDRGLMLFMKLDLGAVLRKESGLDGPKGIRLTIGNPLVMKEMVKHVPDAGGYAPASILVDERADGASLSYDKVERALVPYGNPKALAIATIKWN
ncbi:DUF302 domain-containing protein [Bradyrhizobium sp. Arg68]|uniref:DUF302 domain-containing protein n=1 Tax=Bradyrhizobium ivorense TaxID=2511166 RepID=UPI001E489736|nr:DUF302 domain-containing protein [Bradyrhizobium ivorense]MCC8936594.1 DUF302 domain-containing protein [Bradyrhizobium ivorense]